MRKPKNRVGKTAGWIISHSPKAVRKPAKSLVLSIKKHNPSGRGRKMVQGTVNRAKDSFLWGKKGGKKR